MRRSGSNFRAILAHSRDLLLDLEDRVVGKGHDDLLSVGRADFHLDTALIQIGDKPHRGGAIVLLPMQIAHGHSPLWRSREEAVTLNLMMSLE